MSEIQKPEFSVPYWDNMTDEQKQVFLNIREDIRVMGSLMRERMEAAEKACLFGKLAETNLNRDGLPVVHGCNVRMMNIISSYHEALYALMAHTTREEMDEFYEWRVKAGIKYAIR